jgi:hypothetical protein
MKLATINLIKVKSCHALLRMLLLYIPRYLKSVLKHIFFILYSYHPDTIYLRELGCEDPWLFLKPKGVRAQKCLGNIFSGPLQTKEFPEVECTVAL